MFFSAIFALVGRFLRKVVDIGFEIVLGVVYGFKMDGIEGTVNCLKTVILRESPRRADGLKLPSGLKVRGFRMPAFAWFSAESMDRAIRELENLQIREDDIFVVSYSKCGHHFIHEVLHMLISGETRLAPDTKGTKFLEFFPRPLEYFSKMASPRVILTHLPYDLLPKHILEGKCKIVRISRNPKDVYVSYYHHCLTIKSYFYDDTFDNFMRVMLDEPCDAEYGSYLDFERVYHGALSGRDHVAHITFEALKKKPLETMKGLGEFLGFDHDQGFYEKVAKETSFERVKADKDPKYKGLNEGRSMYRRGVVGDWRNYVTLAMNDEIDAKIEEKWGGTPLMDFFDYGD